MLLLEICVSNSFSFFFAIYNSCFRMSIGYHYFSVISGNASFIREVGKEAEGQGRNNVAFLSHFLTGNLKECLELLIKTNRIPEAAFFARWGLVVFCMTLVLHCTCLYLFLYSEYIIFWVELMYQHHIALILCEGMILVHYSTLAWLYTSVSPPGLVSAQSSTISGAPFCCYFLCPSVISSLSNITYLRAI